jgi:hypothetical protein
MRRYAPCAMWWSFARIIADHTWVRISRLAR